MLRFSRACHRTLIIFIQLKTWHKGTDGALPEGFNVQPTTTSLTVSWTTPGSNDVPSQFTLTLENVVCNNTVSRCEASGLTPGTGYLIEVVDASDNTTSNATYYTRKLLHELLCNIFPAESNGVLFTK